MTKEAKIGMLTGLAVIVLIGVMLSEYLGNGTGPGGLALKPGASSVATGRMADLPIGQSMRNQIMQPVGVPAMVRADGPDIAGGGTTPSIPTAFAAEPVAAAPVPNAGNTGANGPTVSDPVTAIAAGPVQVASADSAMPATLSLDNTDGAIPTPSQMSVRSTTSAATSTIPAKGATSKVAVAKPVGEEYVIARGDTLGLIAKKMYGTSSAAAQARLTDANPTLLKDGKPHVLAGAKILIPEAPVAAKSANTGSAIAKTPAAKPAQEPLVIHPAGTARPAARPTADTKSVADGKATGSKAADAKASPKKPETKAYVVKPGDTLEKIAKRVGGEDYRNTMNKIVAANGIKDRGSLQAGETLKLPM